jgi:hypothetical protein
VKGTTLLASIVMGFAVHARGAQLDCPPGPCVVDVTVDEATCAMSVSADPIMVHKPGAMIFRLQTTGWRFAPDKGIQFKDPPAPGRVLPVNLFTPILSQSSHMLAAIHNRYDIGRPLPTDIGRFPYTVTVMKEDGTKTCKLDPVVANN